MIADDSDLQAILMPSAFRVAAIRATGKGH